ncbi:Protein of unknown function [Alteribacillus persepolensis]|uniref:DUF2777 family protein n=1 Tax=Alteribacillus persepolensis TaxID=568899 RepID=A0A1G7ZAT1_9BACI|nr:DUF2777 family protein [Alteribacillus persepolensis]SDH05729.1 Protein of unknown function [Alteribacillus persepolensis]
MNRIEATKYKGKTVLVDIGSEGVFYGLLEEVYAPPKKTWSGKVFIKGMAKAPVLEKADTIDEKKEVYVTVAGSKIHTTEEEWTLSFNESVVQAIQSAINELHENLNKHTAQAKKWKDIGSVYGDVHVPSTPSSAEEEQAVVQDDYIYYQLAEDDGSVYLLEPINKDTLELEGCPFELEIQWTNNTWIPVTYHRRFTFIDNRGKQYQIQPQSRVRIHKEQFQPFTILLNELEHPARKTLWQRIHAFGFERSHLEDCHNRLLYELLQSENTSRFKGVNFITFRKSGKTLLIQHHYERELKTNTPDYVFDRFECTTDNGERSVSTYTNAYSKDHES